jgi:hypothetical protein
MNNDPLSPEQLTARMFALEQTIGQLVPVVQRLNRAVIEGDSAIGATSLYQRMTDMERRIEQQIAGLSTQLGTVIDERKDEKSQLKGVSRAMRIAGFTSVTTVILFVIAVASFLSRAP